ATRTEKCRVASDDERADGGLPRRRPLVRRIHRHLIDPRAIYAEASEINRCAAAVARQDVAAPAECCQPGSLAAIQQRRRPPVKESLPCHLRRCRLREPNETNERHDHRCRKPGHLAPPVREGARSRPAGSAGQTMRSGAQATASWRFEKWSRGATSG